LDPNSSIDVPRAFASESGGGRTSGAGFAGAGSGSGHAATESAPGALSTVIAGETLVAAGLPGAELPAEPVDHSQFSAALKPSRRIPRWCGLPGGEGLPEGEVRRV